MAVGIYRDSTPVISSCGQCGELLGCVFEEEKKKCTECPPVGKPECTFHRSISGEIPNVEYEIVEACPECKSGEKEMARLLAKQKAPAT